MNDQAVSYSFDDGIATINIDDGKRNALAPDVLNGIYEAFEKAEADKAIIILTGREDVFSAGFDLKVMKRGGSAAIGMLKSGYRLPSRVLNYPYPVIAACNGHSLAMGVFLMLSADYIIGSQGDYKIAANEVAIGMTMPRVAAAVLENRLTPAAYQTAVTVAKFFNPETAMAAGFFDELATPESLQVVACERAEQFKALDERAHTQSKRRIRLKLTRKLRRSVPLDLIDVFLIALRSGKPS